MLNSNRRDSKSKYFLRSILRFIYYIYQEFEIFADKYCLYRKAVESTLLLCWILVSWNLGFTGCDDWPKISSLVGAGEEKTRSDQAEVSLHNSDFKLIKNYLKFCFLSVKMESFKLA